MTEHLDDSDCRAVQRYLLGLPAAEPPAALGAQVMRRQRWRRRRPQLLAAAAAVLLALFIALPPSTTPPHTDPLASQVDPDLLREIRGIDRALQAAYGGAATDSERDALWQARNAAVSRIHDPHTAPVRLLRL